MKKTLTGLSLLLCSLVYGQDLELHMKNGQLSTYGLSTVRKISYSTTEMEIHRVGGTIDKVLLNTITYFKYNQGVVSSIENREETSTISLYPNANQGQFEVNYTSSSSTAYHLRILTISGHEVYNVSGVSGNGVNRLSVSLKDVPNGMYFIELTNGNKRNIERIVISK